MITKSASFIEDVYNKQEHSSLNDCSPLERYLQDYSTLRFDPEEMERCFLHEEKRKVNNDATISLKKIVYEAPQMYRVKSKHHSLS